MIHSIDESLDYIVLLTSELNAESVKRKDRLKKTGWIYPVKLS